MMKSTTSYLDSLKSFAKRASDWWNYTNGRDTNYTKDKDLMYEFFVEEYNVVLLNNSALFKNTPYDLFRHFMGEAEERDFSHCQENFLRSTMRHFISSTLLNDMDINRDNLKEYTTEFFRKFDSDVVKNTGFEAITEINEKYEIAENHRVKRDVEFPPSSLRRSVGGHEGPLVRAIYHNESLGMIEDLLIHHPESIEERDANSNSVLQIAVIVDRLDLVKELISRKLSPNDVNKYSETPIHSAALLNKTEILTELLKDSNANVNVAGAKNSELIVYENLSPLHYAALGNSVGCAKQLVERGANLYSEAQNRVTPMHCAAMRNSADFFKFVLSDSNAWSVLYKKTYWEGLLPIHLACGAGALETVQAMINYDEKLLSERCGRYEKYNDSRYNDNIYLSQRTPIYFAVYRGSYEVVKTIIERNQSVINQNDGNGYIDTPLHLAARLKLKEISELIAKTSLSTMYKKDYYGETPLDIARKFSPDVFRALVNLASGKNTATFSHTNRLPEGDVICLENAMRDYVSKNITRYGGSIQCGDLVFNIGQSDKNSFKSVLRCNNLPGSFSYDDAVTTSVVSSCNGSSATAVALVLVPCGVVLALSVAGIGYLINKCRSRANVTEVLDCDEIDRNLEMAALESVNNNKGKNNVSFAL